MKLTPRQQAIRDAALAPPIPPTQDIPKVAFADALLVMAPKDTASRRRKLFFEFLSTEIERVMIEAGDDFTETDVARITRENIEVMKRDGLTVGEAQNYAAKFSAWRKAKTGQARAVAAKQMHAGKAAKAAEQAAKQRAKEIDAAANKPAKDRKSRVEYHDPKDLEWLADKEAEHLQD